MKENIDDLVEFVSLNNKNNKPKKSKKNKLKLFIINILVIILLISSGMGIKEYIEQKKDLESIKEINNELKSKINNTKEVINDEEEEVIEEEEIVSKPDYSSLVEQNSDMVGWLIVPGTEIDMSVVQTTNNSYYLTHDFNKKWNSMGWAFADYRNSFPGLSKNTIIYGHTYKRTIIFSTLQDVLEKEWLEDKEKQYITFNSNEEFMTFEVFSIYTIKETNDYLITDFTDEEFESYINMIKDRSIKDFNVEVTNDDYILTLSTCYKNANTRLVVHAKKV